MKVEGKKVNVGWMENWDRNATAESVGMAK